MLPNFLGYLENLDYPKDRISLWIRTDHNGDNTTAILAEWAENVKLVYKSVDLKSSDEWLYPNLDPFEEHDERFVHVAQLRQEGLEAARRSGVDYLFRLDCDNFLVNNRTLRILMDQQSGPPPYTVQSVHLQTTPCQEQLGVGRGVHDWTSTEARKKEPDDFKPGRAQLQLHPL
ncbi:procollagen galactosyltransferase 2-like isoform X1 [Halichondria panicea]|uniref:procollagen galactosyltransferase 2-like isoform X1 n=1 Tax=Halichondria panicea TaxID=6063 RepID=UPI00312BAEE3